MAYFVDDEILQGYYVSGGQTINIVKYKFVCDTAADLPAQSDFISSKKIKISMSSTAFVISTNKNYMMQSSGTWTDITDNSGQYTLPPATANSLGGIMVGTGLTIDGAGVLSASGGSSMPYTNHNGGIRGENLGSTYTADQKAAIADGSFSGLYVGDYWLINGIKYVIIDIDYYINYGYDNTPTIQHHLIVFPDDVLSSQGYAYNATWYSDSEIFSTYLPAIAAQLENIYGQYLIAQRLLYVKGDNSYYRSAQKCVLPTFVQMQGYNQIITPERQSVKSSQFAYFRYSQDIFTASQDYWLRDASGEGTFGYINAQGMTSQRANESTAYLRPYFILSGIQQT